MSERTVAADASVTASPRTYLGLMRVLCQGAHSCCKYESLSSCIAAAGQSETIRTCLLGFLQGCRQTGRRCRSSGLWRSGGGGSACSREGTPPPSLQSCCGRCGPPRCDELSSVWFARRMQVVQWSLLSQSRDSSGLRHHDAIVSSRCCGKRQRPTTSNAARSSTCQVGAACICRLCIFTAAVSWGFLQLGMRAPGCECQAPGNCV